jgi:hypothetical protein
MSEPTADSLRAALRTIADPASGKDIVTAGLVETVQVLREAFDEWMPREIGPHRGRTRPRRRDRRRAPPCAGHDTVRAWFWDAWSRMRVALEADAARLASRTEAPTWRATAPRHETP